MCVCFFVFDLIQHCSDLSESIGQSRYVTHVSLELQGVWTVLCVLLTQTVAALLQMVD